MNDCESHVVSTSVKMPLHKGGIYFRETELELNKRKSFLSRSSCDSSFTLCDTGTLHLHSKGGGRETA